MSSLPPKITEALFAHGVLLRDALPSDISITPCTKYTSASNWDQASWPATEFGFTASITKGAVKTKYLLSAQEIKDLPYKCWIAMNGYRSKNYYLHQVERRAWEKYGGPSGLQAAIKATADKKLRAVSKNKTRKQCEEKEACLSPDVVAVSPGGNDPVPSNERALSPVLTHSSTGSRANRTNARVGGKISLDPGSSPTVFGSSPPSRKRPFHNPDILDLTEIDNKSPGAPSSKRRKTKHPLVDLGVIEISD